MVRNFHWTEICPEVRRNSWIAIASYMTHESWVMSPTLYDCIWSDWTHESRFIWLHDPTELMSHDLYDCMVNTWIVIECQLELKLRLSKVTHLGYHVQNIFPMWRRNWRWRRRGWWRNEGRWWRRRCSRCAGEIDDHMWTERAAAQGRLTRSVLLE